MHIQHNISLRPYNTFGIDVAAEYFVAISTVDELKDIAASSQPKHVLGGGSNILLTKPIDGITIHNRLKGITVKRESDEHVWVEVCSGEIWHEFVLYAISNGWAGIENLALIPGTVGAAPMQNIGAYGVEVKDTIESVTCFRWSDRTVVTYSNADCLFGYRDSVFKHGVKDKVFVTSVLFRLNKTPVFHTRYGAVEEELKRMDVEELSIKAIADAVIRIRTCKLPDPKKIGNAGSFFKNPVVSLSQYNLLKEQHPAMPHYPSDGNSVKVPAGWLIEQCGWKGYHKGNAGVHDKQALVLVNNGGASGKEIWQLSDDILDSVHKKFGITLEREVQVW